MDSRNVQPDLLAIRRPGACALRLDAQATKSRADVANDFTIEEDRTWM